MIQLTVWLIEFLFSIIRCKPARISYNEIRSNKQRKNKRKKIKKIKSTAKDRISERERHEMGKIKKKELSRTFTPMSLVPSTD